MRTILCVLGHGEACLADGGSDICLNVNWPSGLCARRSCVGRAGGQTAEKPDCPLAVCVYVCVYMAVGMWTCGWTACVWISMQHQGQGVGRLLSNSNRRRGVSMLSRATLIDQCYIYYTRVQTQFEKLSTGTQVFSRIMLMLINTFHDDKVKARLDFNTFWNQQGVTF